MNSRTDVIVRDPGILGGAPVFRGARVPLSRTFWIISKVAMPWTYFLEEFPSVTQDAAIAALEHARELPKPESGARH